MYASMCYYEAFVCKFILSMLPILISGDAGECTFAGNEFPFVNVTTFPNFQTLNKSEDVTSEPITIPDKLVFGDRIVDTAYVSYIYIVRG